MRTESIKAFVVLSPGYQPSDSLAEDIRLSVRSRLAKHEYPRVIEFVESLPMTTTGKILRRELRDQEREKWRPADAGYQDQAHGGSLWAAGGASTTVLRIGVREMSSLDLFGRGRRSRLLSWQRTDVP